MNRLYKYIILELVILFLLSSCGTIFDEKPAVTEVETPYVYLSITRAQTADSFNADKTDFEDRIHDFAMLVFDSGTGLKVAEYFEESIPQTPKTATFKVKMKPGQRDFFFVANMPIASLRVINTRTEMDSYMAKKNPTSSTLHLGATATAGFPMSRKYLNQTIVSGGTLTSPQPFRPGGESMVNLVRAVAKIEVTVPAAEIDKIRTIKYRNYVKHFLLQQQKPQKVKPREVEAARNFKAIGNGKWVIYAPGISLQVVPDRWNETASGYINYLEITTRGRNTYKIPIVGNAPMNTNEYMRFVRKLIPGREAPDFIVVPNRHYKFNLSNIPDDTPTDPADLTVKYEVVMWDEKEIPIPPFK